MGEMSLPTFSWILFVFSFSLTETENCVSSQNDTGSLYIRQLQEAIDVAVCELVNNTRYRDYSPSDGEEFDFIVVGAGSAGAVVANRLSENPSWRILLLEAGEDPNLTTEIPALNTLLWNTDLDWKYSSEPDSLSCLGSIGKRCTLARGKVLGGSSSINGMVYVRGHPEDFDGWERMGNTGWGFKYLLPYFKKSEDSRIKTSTSNSEFTKYHGVGGLLKVENYQYSLNLNLSKYLSAGFKQLGINRYLDYNIEFGDGIFPFVGNLQNTRRLSTAKAFLFDYQTRSNLKISKKSLVTKILVDGNNTANGVSFTKNGKICNVLASKEVVLSAGAINSPHLLMLSGIGPREHLQQFGIDVKRDSKVGFNLQDHIHFLGFLLTVNVKLEKRDQIEEMFQFLVKRQGPLTTIPALLDTSFITLGQASYRNIQGLFHFFNANSSASVEVLGDTYRLNDDIIKSITKTTSTKPGFIPATIVLRPKSQGRVLLNSSSPEVYPLIYPNYLHKEDDMQVILEAIAFMNSLVKTQPFMDIGAKVERIDIPACRDFEFQSEDYWRCTIRHMTTAFYHQVGTCKMGPKDNEDSVVDPDLRVIGASNLRVIDASIMPTVPSGNINAAVIAIGEKGADLIKQAWGP